MLKEELESVFKGLSINIVEQTRITINAQKNRLLAVLRFLKDRGYDHLALVSCVDWIEENEFELVYILAPYMRSSDEYTSREKMNVILKTRIPREDSRFETATGLFQNAEPYEREIHELFGVVFEGHKRLTPLFLDRWKQMPPFRKDFNTREYVKKTFGEENTP